jgi:hypothetical protein
MRAVYECSPKKQIMITKEKHTLTGDELLVAILAHFPKDTTLGFDNTSRTMIVLYKMSKKLKYAKLFEKYPFDTDGVTPYSPELGNAIVALEACSLLLKTDLLYSRYQRTTGIDIRFEWEIKPKLHEIERQKIKNLAEDIQKSFLTM